MMFPGLIGDDGRLKSEYIPVLTGDSFVGDIRPLFFRAGQLIFGWYSCNGDNYATTSPPGQALLSLPAQYRTDLGIVSSGGLVNVPDLFDSDGDGYFIRGVDGTTRTVGSKQQDAIRNITGESAGSTRHDPGQAYSGALYGVIAHNNSGFQGTTSSGYSQDRIGINASLAVPTANENRPKNIGATYAIYLGVQ
jgi:hypothetical protein